MSKPVFFFQQNLARFLLAVSGIAVCFTIGCARSESPNPVAQGESKIAVSPTQAIRRHEITDPITSKNLMGIWLGSATLDEAKFRSKLDNLTSDQQQLALAKATSFLSTVMSVEYKRDGTLVNDLELISIDGQVLRDGSTGSWKVVESKDDGLVIETQETLSDGSVATGHSYLKFFANGSRFVAAVPVCDDLLGCDAMLVFDRQKLPDASLAEGDSNTQNK